MDGYTNKEIELMTGLPAHLIKFYTVEGVVVPEVAAAAGRGKYRKYSLRNLLQFALVKELSRFGVKIAIIRGFIQGSIMQNVRYTDKTWLEKLRPFLLIFPDDKGGISVTFHRWNSMNDEKENRTGLPGDDVLLRRVNMQVQDEPGVLVASAIVIDVYRLFRKFI